MAILQLDDSQLQNELLTGRELHALVRAVVNANAFVLDNAVTEHLEQIDIFCEDVNGLQRSRDGAGLDGALADLRAADGAPHLVAADAGIE